MTLQKMYLINNFVKHLYARHVWKVNTVSKCGHYSASVITVCARAELLHTTGEAVIIYGLFYTIKMFKTIVSDYELWTIIHFLNSTKSLNIAKIHHQISELYAENAISDKIIRVGGGNSLIKGCENIHYEDHSEQPSIINNDLV